LFPARVLAKKFAISPRTIKKILARDLGMRKFPRRWVHHELTPANEVRRVDARTVLQALRSDSEKNFAYIMADNENWLYQSYQMAEHV
jgi:hypothetical protein